MLRRPDDRLRAARAGKPHRRVRLLHRHHPRIDHPVRPVLPFPAERAGRRPALHNQVVGLLKARPVFRGRVAGVQRLHRRAPHKTGYDAPAADAVQHRDFLGHLDRIVDRNHIPQHGDLRPPGALGNHRRVHIHRRLHAPVAAVVLVGHNAVKPHLIGQLVLVVVVGVEDVRLLRVKVGVGKVHPPRLVGSQVILGDMAVGLFGKPENLKFVRHNACSFCAVSGGLAGWRAIAWRLRRPPCPWPPAGLHAAPATGDPGNW